MTTLERGKVAVVTGAASGIGKSMARAFAARGLRIVLGVHSPGQVDAAVSDPGLRDAEVMAMALDVSDATAVEALMAATVDRFGGVDIVCNNAGTSGSNRPLWESGAEDWEALINVNVMGVVHGIRTFIPYLLAQGHGHVVNSSSMAGLTVFPGNGLYSATKHAVVALSETLRLDLDAVGSKVGVSVLCPGPVDTPLLERGRRELLEHFATLATQHDLSSATVGTTPISPDDVAQLVIEGIESDQLYIFPNPGSAERIRERMTHILEGAGID
ncbi:MAG TPA: SDR family NAD(P)-dependent oxidoreductase [Jatrophihabitantaceae bacterium]|jgi:NADP-dependent 3-hydroxy acid dehydrogenase YdfG|nr:SDR family NAD(P)-dependent oxidoreductase [Jatrophihabitantaceae bacterium]